MKANVLTALDLGVPAIIGTSGLSAEDYAEIAARAEKQGLGVVASGNFSLTAAHATRFAVMAAKHVADYEIIDYANYSKPDVPSGDGAGNGRAHGRRSASVPACRSTRSWGPKEPAAPISAAAWCTRFVCRAM